MRSLHYTNRFKKDFKRAKKRGQDLAVLQRVLDLLILDKDLPEACRPHKLSGTFDGIWECHLKPDWLLLYDLDLPDRLTLIGKGSHSDLFD